MALNSTHIATDFPWYHITRESVVPYIPDQILILIAPIVEYWIVSLAFHLLDISGWDSLEKYRVQPSAEILRKNLATKREVVETVMKMQVLQTAFGYMWVRLVDGDPVIPNYAVEVREMELLWLNRLASWFGTHFAAEFMRLSGINLGYVMYWWVYPLGQLAIGMAVLDTYQYFVHRTLHEIPFLYRHLHSVHHRQYVPYAYGSQYNHPFEGAIVDGLSAIVSSSAARMFFHEIHHQSLGLKSNFSQPLFVFWDRLLGTYMSAEEFEAKKAAKHKKN